MFLLSCVLYIVYCSIFYLGLVTGLSVIYSLDAPEFRRVAYHWLYDLFFDVQHPTYIHFLLWSTIGPVLLIVVLFFILSNTMKKIKLHKSSDFSTHKTIL